MAKQIQGSFILKDFTITWESGSTEDRRKE